MTSPSAEPASLQDLLAASDLDALLAAREALDGLDADDDARLLTLVEQWQDVPALANVLMYPEVLPEDVRLPALLRAVRDREEPYLSLAASVGLQRLAEDPMEDDPEDDEALQAEVVAALGDLVDRGSGAVAARAGLARHLWLPRSQRGALPPLARIPSHQEWREQLEGAGVPRGRG